jgi:phosphatidylserine decarboxylase
LTEPIRIWNRQAGHEEIEKVYGGAGVSWLYGNPLGRLMASGPLSQHWPSRLYGAYQSSKLSRHKIRPFIHDFAIRMDEFEPRPFSSFNDFFSRRFRDGARRFVPDPGRMPAFCEARYLAFEKVDPDRTFPVKGELLSPRLLLAGNARATAFEGGPLLIARLCPTDYHRYHYPDGGRTLEHWSVPGRLHSVNPAALQVCGEIFATNERRVSVLETQNFGLLAYIEVGALCVGLIQQTHPETDPFERGTEKGTFLFGASTVILLGQKGAWRPDADLVEQTEVHRRETLVRLGQGIAVSSPK